MCSVYKNKGGGGVGGRKKERERRVRMTKRLTEVTVKKQWYTQRKRHKQKEEKM